VHPNKLASNTEKTLGKCFKKLSIYPELEFGVESVSIVVALTRLRLQQQQQLLLSAAFIKKAGNRRITCNSSRPSLSPKAN